MGKTRTGKDEFKTLALPAGRTKPAALDGIEALRFEHEDTPYLHLAQDSLPRDFATLAAKDSFFGRLPRIWAKASAGNRMTGETCVPIGRPPASVLDAFGKPVRMGINFMVKGAFWPDILQVPEAAAHTVPVVLPIASYLKENLPEARLWPAVEIVFKLSAGFVRNQATGLDPFLDKKQATGFHTDGDSAEEAKRFHAGDSAARIVKPAGNSLALLKQRLIISTAVPTAFTDDWSFEQNLTAGFNHAVKSNGYPVRYLARPTVFPAGTAVSFTNNNMHSATYADRDTHRTVAIVSGTVNWKNLRRLPDYEDILRSLSEEAPASLLVPAAWHKNFQETCSPQAVAATTQACLRRMP